MNFLLSIILIMLAILEIRKSFLILRKNQTHTFLGVQILYLILGVFVSRKKLAEIQKNYKND